MNTPLVLCPRRWSALGLSLALLVGFGSISRSQPADENKLREELRQLKTVYENAISSGDFTPLEPLFDAGTSGVTIDNQSFKTLAELKSIYDRFRASFPGVIYRIKLNYEPSQIFGDLVVAHGTTDEYVKTADGEFNYTGTWTIVMRRVNGNWKLVRSQITMDPFRNSIVTFLLGKTKLYFGGGALLAGMLAGFVLARWLSARKASA